MSDSQYAIAQFVSDDTVAQLAGRIITLLPKMLPNAAGLDDNEALALSQVALLHNLSPFNGEIWYLKGNGRSLGVMPGIKGYRKHARRALRAVDPNASYTIEYRIAQPQEAEAKEGSLVVEAILRVSLDIDAYLRSKNLAYEGLKGLGGTFAEIDAEAKNIVGPPPLYKSFGVIRPDEFKRFDDARLNKLAQAHVRAERGVLRQRFDLEMGQAAYRGDWEATDVDILDGLVEQDDLIENAQPQTSPERKARTREEIAKMDAAIGIKR